MSLSLDQLFLSPNEEKKVQLQNRPYIVGSHDSSDDSSDEELSQQANQKRKNVNCSNDNLSNENKIDQRAAESTTANNEHFRAENLNRTEAHRTENRQSYSQLTSQPSQSNYAAFSSNQILRNSQEMSNNLNYPINLVNYKPTSSTGKQNDRIKYRKNHYNEQDDYASYQTDDLLNDLSQKNEIKNQENDLINRKPASALIKKGDLFKNVDYFNRSSVPETDEDLYSNRKIERRKARKSNSQNFQEILQLDTEYAKKKECQPKEVQNKDSRSTEKRSRDFYVRPSEKAHLSENYDNFQNRTRFINKNGNYHYVQIDANKKRASVSSADISISKCDTQSSSSSNSPTPDRKTDLNEIICFENKYIGDNNPQPNYIGFDLETVMRDNMNKKSSKDLVYSSANSSILDEDTNLATDTPFNHRKLPSSHSSQKLSALNDLLSIENEESNSKNSSNDHDVLLNTDFSTIGTVGFSSSIMHKSTKQIKNLNERKCAAEKELNFNLVDFNNKDNDKFRDASPELLKFNDEDYDSPQFIGNKKSSDLLTDDTNCSSFKDLQDQSVIHLISNTQSVLQPKIMNTCEFVDLNLNNKLNDQESHLDDADNSKESSTLINSAQNSLTNETEKDEDKNETDDVTFSQLTAKSNERRRSSDESSSLKEFRQINDESKDQPSVYSSDMKRNVSINSHMDSSTSSESTFNSTVISNNKANVPGTSINKQATYSNNESTSSIPSLEGTSPKKNGIKTPGYTQRVLNANSNTEQVKYGLFQLGNVSNNLIDIDIEQNHELKDEEMSGDDHLSESDCRSQQTNQKQQFNNPQAIASIQRDISRDELVKSILNIPFSKYDSLDQIEDDNLESLSRTQSSHQSSLNSSLNSAHKSTHLNRNSDHPPQQQTIASDFENLTLSDDKSQVANRNASLGDIRLNSSACRQLKDSSLNGNQSVNNVNNVNIKSNLKGSRQGSNASLEQQQQFENAKCRNSGSINNSLQNFSIDEQSLGDCLDLVLDKSLTNNLNFVSNSMSNSNLLGKTANKLSNGRLVDYMLDDCNKMDVQKSVQQQSVDSLIDKSEESESTKLEEDKRENDQILVDTSDISTTASKQCFNQSKYDKSTYLRKEPFNQHKMQSKILQDTVSNHLLSDSLIDITDDTFTTSQYEQYQSNKKSPKKHKNFNSDLCYLDNNVHHNRIADRNYSSRNILNTKFNSHHIKNSEDSMRNFSLSPETDCDSVEVESEFSISSFVSVPGLNQMPILEDGLSSGSASDVETSQTAKQDNERPKKHRESQNKLMNNLESPEMEIFAKCRPRIKKNQHLSDYDLNSESYNCGNSNLKSNLCEDRQPDDKQHMKKSRSLNLNNNMHMSNGLDSSETEHTNDLTSEQLWNERNAKLQQTHQPQPSRGHLDYNQSIGCENQSDNEAVSNSLLKSSDEKPKLNEKTFHEDDCDTDTETDRLLGAQRSDDRAFYEDKNPSIKKKSNSKEGTKSKRPSLSRSVLIEGVLFRARYLGSTQLICDGQPTKAIRMMQAEEAVSRIKAPEGETQPSTEVDLFISTEKIMVLNTDLKEIMMDHVLRSISYIADIGDLLVLMAKRRPQIIQAANDVQNNVAGVEKIKRPTPKMICHVFESEEAQFIAQSIGQAFQVAYMDFLKANGIEDSSFVKEMDYQEVLNSQEIYGNELEMFARKEKQKEVIVPKRRGEILGVVIVESGWGSLLPAVVIANMAQSMPAARCGALNIGDQIISINGISLVGLPLTTCQHYIRSSKNQTVVKLNIVPCPPVVEVKIKRPDTKYQLGFSVQNGVICSLLRGGIAERGGVRVGHRIIEINGQSVVAVPHEKIVNLLATSVGTIHMKTMPTSMFRLLTGQERARFE